MGNTLVLVLLLLLPILLPLLVLRLLFLMLLLLVLVVAVERSGVVGVGARLVGVGAVVNGSSPPRRSGRRRGPCLLYTSDAADE